MPLSRRAFVQSLGAGAAGVLTSSYIGARGREQSVWSMFEPSLQAVDRGVICLSSNPTATYVGAKATRDFIAKVNRESPDTTILIDEAYFDYVTDPDHETHVPVAIENPRVMVARTFSKAYGMAGLRMGYAIGHVDTIKKMAEWDGGSGGTSL